MCACVCVLIRMRVRVHTYVCREREGKIYFKLAHTVVEAEITQKS